MPSLQSYSRRHLVLLENPDYRTIVSPQKSNGAYLLLRTWNSDYVYGIPLTMRPHLTQFRVATLLPSILPRLVYLWDHSINDHRVIASAYSPHPKLLVHSYLGAMDKDLSQACRRYQSIKPYPPNFPHNPGESC